MRYYSQSFSRLLLNILLIALAAGAAFGQYPATGNKQRLGFQTTGDGLVYRGAIGDTATIDPVGIANAWMLIDTATGFVYAYRGYRWQLVTAIPYMPFDSVTFNDNQGDADSAELKYNADIGSLIYGGNDGAQIPVLPGHWYVRNDDTITLTKGTVVMATGTLGASGRILAKRMVADGSVNAMYILGIVAKDIPVGEDGYVMWQGKLRKMNTTNFNEGDVLYPDNISPGVLINFPPFTPSVRLPIAFVVHKSATNGVIAVRVTTGNYLSELHDVSLGSYVKNDILRYNGSLWGASKDTSIYDHDAYLKNNRNVLLNNFSITFRDSMNKYDNVDIRDTYVSVRDDSMDLNQTLFKYGLFSFQDNNTLQTIIHNYNGNISFRANTSATTTPLIDPDIRILGDGRISFRHSAGGSPDSLYAKNSSGYLTATANTLGQKLNISDTLTMLANYVNIADTAAMLATYINASDTASMLSTYLRPSEILAGTGITLVKDSTVTISAPTTLSSATENKGIAEVVVDGLSTLRLPWDGTAVVGILKDYLYFFVNVNGQSSQHPLIPDGKKGDIITSQGGATLTIDTGAVNLAKLSSGVRDTLAAKLNIADTASLSSRIDAKLNASDTVKYVKYVDTLTTIGTKANLALKLNAADTASLSNRIDARVKYTDTVSTIATKANLTLKLNAADTASLSSRIDLKLNIADTAAMLSGYIKDSIGTVASTNLATGAVTGAKLGAITSAELRAALTDATGTGAAVFGTNPTISGATISGGSINNTPIGASTANTGAFTTVTASSTLTVTGAGSIQGLTVGRGNNSFATNTALGASTLTATQTGGVSGGGQNNTAVGYQAMQSATSSQLNTAVGANALRNLTNAIGVNTAVGYNALLNTNANSNTAMGYRVMETNTSGEENAAFGYESLFDNTSGQDNAAFGYRSLDNNTTGSNNTALGYLSLTNNTTGSNNVAVGYWAGRSSATGNTTGNHNIYLGVSSVGSANNNWNEIVIGSGAVGNGKNSVTLGNDTIATTILRGRVGIRQTSPLQALHVRGKVRIDTLSSTPLFIAGIGTDSTVVRLSTDSLPSIAELKNVKGLNSNIQAKIDSASIYKTNGTLTGHRTVNMDAKNIYFKSNAASDDTIKVGYDAELGYNSAISFKDGVIRSVHYERGIETYSSNFGVNRRAYMYMDDGDLRFFADSSTNLGSPTADRAALNIDRNAFVQVRNLGRRAPVTITDATYTVADNVTWIICNRAGTVTLTLPNATTYTGREITVKTVQAQTVISAASNVVPITDTAAGTAILPATDGAWALLVSDGTNWIIMQKGQ